MRISSFTAAMSIACITLGLASPSLAQSLPRFGLGAKISTLGFGIEAATAVTKQSNLRGGVNFRLGLDREISSGRVDYSPEFQYQSVEAHFDWFFGGFHISPGLLVRDSPETLVNGFDTGLNRASPMLTLGWGNMLSRKGGRFSFNIEGGVLFRGSSEITSRSVADPCLTLAELCPNLGFLDDIRNEFAASTFARYYPVLSIGIGFRIK